MILRLLIAIYSSTAFAQAFDSFIKETADPGIYSDKEMVGPNSERQWPKIKSDLTVTMKPASSVYSWPQYAVNKDNLSLLPWNRWKDQCERAEGLPPLKGRLMHVTRQFAMVELDEPQNFCGSFFNSENQNRRLVFVRREDVATIVPRANESADAKTEAVGVPEKKCEICKLAKTDEALRAMVKKASEDNLPTSPEKKESEMNRYMLCHKTEYQDNYNRFYKKLFDIAGKVFQVAYTPGKNGSIKPILDPQALQNETNLPFIVKAQPVVMKCVGLRESRWNPLAVSNTEAMGIGQQTKPNVKHINCDLNGCTEKGKWQPKKKWAGALWDKYFKEAEAAFSPEDWNRLMTHPKTGKPCTRDMADKERDAPCPVNSIGAMALYHVIAELQMRSTSPLYKGANDNRDFDDYKERLSFKIIQGATTNAGTGTTRNTIEKFANPLDWVKNIGSVSTRPGEVGGYTNYLGNCLTSGNMDPMYDLKKGQAKPDCYSKKINEALGVK